MSRKIYAVRKKNTDKMCYVMAETSYRATIGAADNEIDAKNYEVLGEHTTADFLRQEAKYKDRYTATAERRYEAEFLEQSLKGAKTGEIPIDNENQTS